MKITRAHEKEFKLIC
ncbi:hypothetical protein SOVF_191290, partial [Spinacia oleracea]